MPQTAQEKKTDYDYEQDYDYECGQGVVSQFGSQELSGGEHGNPLGVGVGIGIDSDTDSDADADGVVGLWAGGRHRTRWNASLQKS